MPLASLDEHEAPSADPEFTARKRETGHRRVSPTFNHRRRELRAHQTHPARNTVNYRDYTP